MGVVALQKPNGPHSTWMVGLTVKNTWLLGAHMLASVLSVARPLNGSGDTLAVSLCSWGVCVVVGCGCGAVCLEEVLW